MNVSQHPEMVKERPRNAVSPPPQGATVRPFCAPAIPNLFRPGWSDHPCSGRILRRVLDP